MKVLFMSGYPSDIVDGHGRQEPGLFYLAKPFSGEALAARVREVLTASARPAAVLVVDDEAGVRGYFQRVLAGAGFHVQTAANGEEALRMAQTRKFEAVLTDLVMPEREGIETIRELRRQQPQLKIIAVSGAFDGAFLKLAQGLGAHATLKKPVSPGDLIVALQSVLG